MRTDKKLYIIARCNGAGKTTASYNILPEVLDCKEFVNADEIARGLSPFQPEKVGIKAGRIMLQRIDELFRQEVDFAIETTLATRSYVKKIKKAREECYTVSLVFFWLSSVDLARERVKLRVAKGGHNIPKETINRRYYAGLRNFFELYLPICDNVSLFNNSDQVPDLVMIKKLDEEMQIINEGLYSQIKNSINE